MKYITLLVVFFSALSFGGDILDDGVIADKDIPTTSVDVKITAKKIFKMKDPQYGTDMALVSEPRLTFTPAITVGAGTLESPKVEVKEAFPYVLPSSVKTVVDDNCFFICRTLGYLTCEPTKSMMSAPACVVGKEWAFDYDRLNMRWSMSRCTSGNWRVWNNVTCIH